MKNLLKYTVLPVFVCFLYSFITLKAQVLDDQFPTVNGNVKTICIQGNTIYIGGTFTEVGGAARTNIAAIDIPSKSVTDWAPALNGDVTDIEADQGKVYFCGHFTQVNSSNRNALAAVDSISGETDLLNPSISFPGIPGMQTGTVGSLEIKDNILYFAGYFISVNGNFRTDVAALDLPSGDLNSFKVSPDIPVNIIEIEGNTLFMGGPFYKVNGMERKGFAAVDRLSGALLPWNPICGNPGNTIYAIVPDGNSVFVSGIISGLHGINRCFLAKTDMAGVPNDWTPFECGSTIISAYAMLKSGNRLLIGGEFSSFDGIAHRNLVQMDRLTGVVDIWSPEPNDRVFALGKNDSLLVVGGAFDEISGVSRPHLAVYSIANMESDTSQPQPALRLIGYPNPARSSISINLPQHDIRNMMVFSRDGRAETLAYQVDDLLLTIQTEHLQGGSYVVRFETPDGKRYVTSFTCIK